MTPRSHLRAALLALAVVLAPPAVARPDREAEDALARYLDSRDLKSLLIDHLEGALSHASPDERPGVAERLSALYAEALERAPTADERTALERRARALLDTVPEAEGFDLRLNLHRASYARAEQAAERRRLLLATPEETEEAARSLRTLIVDLVQIGAAANKRVDALEKQEQGAGDLDSSLLRDALAAARRHRSLAMYLAGWSGTYLAELTSEGVVGDTKPGPAGAAPPGVLATESAKRFGWLLNAPPNAAPTIDRVPEASLRLEHVARAALGVGTCASIRGDYAEAVRWFDLVEHAADAPAQVRAEIFARRFVAAAHNAEWIDALRLLRQRRGVETPTGTAATPVNPLTPTEARLVAALSFKAQPPQRSATVVQKLREVALADLVARDELSQLLDLTNRFGTESLTGLGDAKGFIVAYIRGLQSFGRARDAHKKAAEESPAAVKPDDPTADRAVVALYEDAQALLKAAGTATDADKFGPARANAAMLLGMSAFYSATEPATAVAAAERFAAAATLAQSPAALADAAWMRVRALDLAADLSDKAAKDKQAKAGSAESRALADIVSRRDAARAEFLAKFPSDARAGTLLLRRSIAASKATADASTGGTGANSTGGAPSKPLPADANATIEALLKVAPDAPTYAASRREAARLLYIAARDAAEPARVAAVNRFAGVAEPLLAEDAAAAGPSSAETAVRAKVVARQLLDAYLSGPERLAQPQRARPVLETLAALESRGALSLDDCRSEILYRRLQVAAMLGEAAEADAVADALAALPAGSPAAAPDRFVVAGRRLLLSRAMTEWKRGPQSAPLARALVKHGERALAAAGNAAPDDATIAAQAAVAEAGAFLWTNEQDESAKALALKLLHAALAARPSSEPILRQAAQFAPLAGEATFGAECWKRLLAGAEIGAPKWFEATYGLASALKDSQPAAARDLLERCRALFPDFGPEPWGSKLRQLDEALRGGGAK